MVQELIALPSHEPSRRGVVTASRQVRVFWGLIVLNASCIAAMPALPGHDTPQHLAYVRIMASLADPALALDLGALYEAPDLRDPYVTTYRVLAWFSRLLSVELVAKAVLIVWSIALTLALRQFIRSTWRDAGPLSTACASALLAPFFVWSPAFFMGFVPFVLALAPLVAWLAASVRFASTGAKGAIGLATALAFTTSLLHAVAAAAGATFLALFWIARRDRRSFVALGCGVTAMVLAQSTGTAHAVRGRGALLEAIGQLGFVDAVGLVFSHPLEKANMALASVLGPFPWPAQLALGAAALATLVVVRRTNDTSREGPVRGVRAAALGFGVLALLAPASVRVPDDLSLIDFRLLVVAAMLAIVWLPPARVASGPGALAFLTSSTLATVIAASCGLGVAWESAAPARLVRALGTTDRLLALPLLDASAFLDPRNRVLHYTSVWHTVQSAGVTSSFWARFSPRLPIGYRPSVEPPHPRDFQEWTFDPAVHLAGWTHLLVSAPPADDDETRHEAYARVLRLEQDGQLARVDEQGPWRLYRVAAPALRDSNADPSALCRECPWTPSIRLGQP